MDINNLEKFKTKMASGKMCIGTVITLSDPAVSELAGDAGMDFTWIDAEHSPHTLESVMGHVMALRGTDCAPLVRVAWNDAAILKPVLDLAPAGVIIPMVCTAEEAKRAVEACKYPPKGIRGFGVRRAVKYGQTDLDSYIKTSENEPMVIIQIEHINAVRNLDAILNVPGIDSICIGPCDLSASMGLIQDVNGEEVNKVIDEICIKTKEAGLLLGTASAGPRWKKRGTNWIALTSDYGSMFAQYRKIIGENA